MRIRARRRRFVLEPILTVFLSLLSIGVWSYTVLTFGRFSGPFPMACMPVLPCMLSGGLMFALVLVRARRRQKARVALEIPLNAAGELAEHARALQRQTGTGLGLCLSAGLSQNLEDDLRYLPDLEHARFQLWLPA